MIRYACVAAGVSILAEHEHDPGRPLSSLAVQCLQAAPEFHAVYTHTVRKRMYAFLTQDQIEEARQNQEPPLMFFAIADEPLGRAKTLLFLHHLRESFESEQRQHERHLDLPQLVLFFNSNGVKQQAREGKEKARSPRGLDCGGGEERRQDVRKAKKGKKRKEGEESSDDDGHEMEIAVVDWERDRRHLAPAAVGKKSVEEIWRQHVRIVILLDVVICSIMLGIWLGVSMH